MSIGFTSLLVGIVVGLVNGMLVKMFGITQSRDFAIILVSAVIPVFWIYKDEKLKQYAKCSCITWLNSALGRC